MAKSGSFIKIDRGLKNNSLWLLEKPFTKGQAWVDLLMLAQGVEKSREYRGKQQMMKRGNVYTSIYFLSDRWGWGRMKVYRFLEKLMIDEMIEVQGWKIDDTTNRTVHRDKLETTNDTTSNTVISIVNWDLYQCSDTSSETTNRPVRCAANDTTDRTHKRKYIEKDTEKERKKKNKEKEIASSPPLDGGSDAPKAKRLKPIDEGTVDDIPEEYRDFCKTYAEYWGFRNR